MRNRFVETSNVQSFVAAVSRVERRAAPEACIVLVGGDAGLGKSRTGLWWAMRNDAVVIQVKAASTPNWVLTDLVRELGLAPERTCEKLFGQAIGALAVEPRPIVVDEVEHALSGGIESLEMIRGVSDMTEVPVILIGREHVKGRLQRHRQLWTRVGAVAEFGLATIEDVRLICDQLVEGEVDDSVVAEVHRQTEGRMRELVKAVSVVDGKAQKYRGRPVALADIGGEPLCHDWQRRRKSENGKVAPIKRKERERA